MKSDFQRIVRVFDHANLDIANGRKKIFAALSLQTPIAHLYIKDFYSTESNTFIPTLKYVSQVIATHHVEWQITDWPFEHFWGNPHEPRHSKLLAYLIDPNSDHGCGKYLLGKLLKILGASISLKKELNPDACKILRPETDNIDICIENNSDEFKFAIIIENKVNNAKNQDRQLERYVTSVLNRNFKPEEIYVFFLPFTDYSTPNKSDQIWMSDNRIVFKTITFDKELLRWLETALWDWPQDLPKQMSENLHHYYDLINFLNRTQKQNKMNYQILKQLEKAEHDKSPITMAEVKSLKGSLDTLEECLKQVLRAKLFLEAQKILSRKYTDVSFFQEKYPPQQIQIDSPFDLRFRDSINLCIDVNSAVKFGVGANRTNFWFGYMKGGDLNGEKKIEKNVLKEAAIRLGNVVTTDQPWFAWKSFDGKYPDISEMTIMDLANQISKQFEAHYISIKSKLSNT